MKNKIWDVPQPRDLDQSGERVQKYANRLNAKCIWWYGQPTHIDAKVLLDIPFPMNYVLIDHLAFSLVDICLYCLTKISTRAKRSISRVFSLFIVPSPFFVHCPYKRRINRAKAVLTAIYGFCHCF